LVDDVGAVAHRRERGLDGIGPCTDHDDAELLRAQVLQVLRLVLAAAFDQQLEDRILAVRPFRAPFRDREIELGQMHAAEMLREVGGGELQRFGDEAHRVIIEANHRAGYRSFGALLGARSRACWVGGRTPGAAREQGSLTAR
jgi:hypothetical protein